ncbi:MAG: selenoneine synthase SenA [Polaromonas sp.]|nr:selenoneine synthase SenA [Polaromonas sp.]
MRGAGKDVLSLALMDARNHTLRLFGHYQQAIEEADVQWPASPGMNPPLWTLGHIGWFQEWWVGRNMQRSRGMLCEPVPTRLASIEPQADGWWNPAATAADERWKLALPGTESCRAYLLDTLEGTLDLLEKAGDDDEALYFYRLCLFHEDMQGELLTHSAQALGLPLEKSLVQAFTPSPMTVREPLLVPATVWQAGTVAAPGFAFDNEQAPHEVRVPEFEIDAQPVSWAQFVEFVDDGGYDREALWSPGGWAWLQATSAREGRRGPRYVEEIGVASGAVMQTRFGDAKRMLGNQPAMHMSWWEADAWCRWAGRRLPAEVEWELAAHTAARRGFRWGDVWEWTGSSFRPYPGFTPGPYAAYSQPFFGTHKVLRGGSFATRARMKHLNFRNFCLPGRDELFCGFRSCAL